MAPLALLLAATLWGLVWYPYRLLEQAGLEGSIASVLTYLVALPLLFALRAGRAWPQEWGLLLALALSAGWTNLSYVLAVIHGEVVRVMLLFYLAPLWTVPIAHLLLKERAGRVAWLVIVLAVAGAWVMLAGESGLPVPQGTAEWLALSSGMGFALSNVLTRRLRATSIAQRSLWVFAGVVAISASYAYFAGVRPVIVLDVDAWFLVLGIAIALLLATISVQYGLARTPANQAVVILLAELVVAAIASRTLAGEVMDRREWVGGAMIVAATLFSGWMEEDA